ncbi:type II toxin-antitoxin system HicA family toxin [Methanoplanus limicola]|nr:hypothetical protein [Methanoplanus limicola]
MSRLLPVTGKQMCRILERLGYIRVHQSGSPHQIYSPGRKKNCGACA